MKKDLFAHFRRQSPGEILQERVERDRFIPAFVSFLFIEVATSVIFPSIDLYNYMARRTATNLRTYMHISLGYAFLCSVIIGAVVILMAVIRLRAIERKTVLKGSRLFKIGLYGTAGLIAALLFAWIIV